MRVTGVLAVGFKADAWLAASRGRARVLAPRATSAWLVVGDGADVVWLGGADEPAHGRAVLCATPPGALEHDDLVEIVGGVPWRPCDVVLDPWRVVGAARRLADAAASLGEPAGFGGRLAGRPLTFPLDKAGAAVDALARACARDDASAAADAASELIGVGGGLTPSGDDLVGGAFFARAHLSRTTDAGADAWRDAAGAVRDHARRCTHPISAVLLGDLLDGEGWAPLHDCAAALGRGDDLAAFAAARRLTMLGHSSGWDVLTGLLAGIAG